LKLDDGVAAKLDVAARAHVRAKKINARKALSLDHQAAAGEAFQEFAFWGFHGLLTLRSAQSFKFQIYNEGVALFAEKVAERREVRDGQSDDDSSCGGGPRTRYNDHA